MPKKLNALQADIFAALQSINRRCSPALSSRELEELARDVTTRYPRPQEVGR